MSPSLERARKVGIGLFSLTFAVVVAIDVMPVSPVFSDTHRVLKGEVDFLLDATGLWQGEWNLFAPNVDSNNSRVEALVIYSDGSQMEWRSVEWVGMSPWERLRIYRYLEFYDDLTQDSAACESFARYLARTVKPSSPAAQATQVRVFELNHQIPPPDPDAWVPAGPYPVAGGKRLKSCVWKKS